MRRRRSIAVVVFVLAALVAPGARGATTYGDVEFPLDEHQHLGGWDYFWGAADLLTESGNRYTVGLAFDSFYGYGVSGHQVFPHQGPYEGLSIMSADGPTEWGHPGEVPGQFLRVMTLPSADTLPRYQTLDVVHDLKDIGRWERTSAERESYHLRIDNDTARVHPTGAVAQLVIDLDIDMQGPPLLAGGTGTWWYGIPESFGYPSRSFQYMQAAETLAGTLDLQQPDGSVLHETVVSSGSSLLMVHEYDASPEDLPVGLALAEATQLHPRYAQYYPGGMPWELLFLDLGNGAQLMFAVLAFHDTDNGSLTPIVDAPLRTYYVLATLRLPSGESIPLDDDIRIEHLSYRSIVGRVPTFMVQVTGVWTQAWEYRVSYPGGTVTAPSGVTVDVPSFDLGVVPQFGREHPAIDNQGNRLAQRVPFVAHGSYDGCPVHGFGWSEVIINWYGYEGQDPWFTGGALPPVPAGCDSELAPPPAGPPGDLTPPAYPVAPPNLAPEGCTAFDPAAATSCTYDAAAVGGVGGYGSRPGGWKVTITRPGRADPIVVTSFGSVEFYPCGTIRPGDRVVVEAGAGSGVVAGNPGICF